MDDHERFEQDVADMLEDRVGGLPTSYDIDPALLERARRRRTAKVTAFAVAAAVVVIGTTGAIAQSVDDGPRRLSTSSPTSTSPRPSVPTPPTATSTTLPSVGPSSIADPPFSPMSWSATANGVVISKYDGIGPFAVYNSAADTWRGLPAPSFVQPMILAARGNRVFVVGGTADRSSTTMSFAMIDTGTGAWRTLAPLPDRAFGVLTAAGDTDRIFVYGEYDDDYAATDRHEVALEYDIASDAWTRLPRSPLRVRSDPAMEWTGRELLVWGGGDYLHGGLPAFSDGATFDPATGSWRSMAAAPVPARAGSASAWTGTEMLVWGGSSCVLCGGSELGDGAAYDPATDTWRRLGLSPLRATALPAAVWSGREMIVLSGRSVADTTDVAAYDPATDQWRSLPAAPAAARSLFQANQAVYAALIGRQSIFGIVTPGGQFAGFKYTIG